MTSERVRISKSVLDGLKAQVEEQKDLASINADLEAEITRLKSEMETSSKVWEETINKSYWGYPELEEELAEARRWAIKLFRDGKGMYQEILELRAENAKMRDIIKSVKWQWGNGDEELPEEYTREECILCKGEKPNHTKDCPIGLLK